MNYLWTSSAALAALLALVLAAAPVPAMQVLVGSGGFEDRASPPDYQTGNLAGQNSWLVTPGSTSTATVAATANGQVVQVDHQLQDRRWAVLPTGNYPTGRYITISWDMAVAVTESPNVLGPFFGVEAYGADGNFTVLGSLGVDATSGEVLIQQAGQGYLMAPGPTVNSGEWNHFTIELDYQEDVYRTYLNGSLVTTMNFVDDDKNELDSFSDADISSLAVATANGTGQAGTDTAWFDNFLVVDGIPGDFNADGIVNLADYTVWRDSLGATGLAPAGEAYGDGVVNSIDYHVWKSNFGRSNLLTAQPLHASAMVPEPASWTLPLMALLVSFRSVVRRATSDHIAQGDARRLLPRLANSR